MSGLGFKRQKEEASQSEAKLSESDSELVSRAKQGDTEAFELLIRRYERSVRCIAWAFLHDGHSCEDVLQETFIGAFKGLHALNDSSRFSPWLMQIARRAAQRISRESRISVDGQSTVDELSAKTCLLTPHAQHLLELVERLPENERNVISMRYFDGHTAQDISDITGKPLGTITKQLSRAYDRLRGWFGANEEIEDEQ